MIHPSFTSRKYCSATCVACDGRAIRCQCAPPSAVLKSGTPPCPTTSPCEPSALKRICTGPGPSQVSCCCQVRPPSVVLYTKVGPGPVVPLFVLVSATHPTSDETNCRPVQSGGIPAGAVTVICGVTVRACSERSFVAPTISTPASSTRTATIASSRTRPPAVAPRQRHLVRGG